MCISAFADKSPNAYFALSHKGPTVHYSLEGAQKRGGEGGSDLPSVSSVEFLRVSKNISHICQKLSDLLQTAFFYYFFIENFVKILIDKRGRY